MRKELFWIGVVAYWLTLLGFVAPALISSDSTELALAGMALLAGSTYATYRLLRRTFTTKETANEPT